eukprot:Rhum_TRINITY_DN12132_c0_g3::Rhum_TRINITY_DN12132_c0_g3_i1::g.49572::m.49572
MGASTSKGATAGGNAALEDDDPFDPTEPVNLVNTSKGLVQISQSGRQRLLKRDELESMRTELEQMVLMFKREEEAAAKVQDAVRSSQNAHERALALLAVLYVGGMVLVGKNVRQQGVFMPIEESIFSKRKTPFVKQFPVKSYADLPPPWNVSARMAATSHPKIIGPVIAVTVAHLCGWYAYDSYNKVLRSKERAAAKFGEMSSSRTKLLGFLLSVTDALKQLPSS